MLNPFLLFQKISVNFFPPLRFLAFYERVVDLGRNIGIDKFSKDLLWRVGDTSQSAQHFDFGFLKSKRTLPFEW